LLAGQACGSSDSSARYFLALRWSFADSRDCVDAGVATIRVRDEGSLVTRALFTNCSAGLIGAGATPQSIGEVPAGERSYDVDALSADGGTLYHGALSVDASMKGEADVVLVFVGTGGP
jgi:hypothetical protein